MLPQTDRWANTVSAIVIDRWVNEFASLSGGYIFLGQGSIGERRAANVLYMLWSIARFGPKSEQNRIRRELFSILDIPYSHLNLMQEWWELSLGSVSKKEVDHEFEEYFQPTFYQVLLDRCIVRAAIACQHLQDEDLEEIANEDNIEQWANKLGRLSRTCEILTRQRRFKASPTVLIAGPTTTGKSEIAWGLAETLCGVTIASDPFQICAILPIALGVGLPTNMPLRSARTRLYREKIPSRRRPSPEVVADWVSSVVNDENFKDMPIVIEGGSISSAMAILNKGIPTHVIVFDVNCESLEEIVNKRMSTYNMNIENLLTEAHAVRGSGFESTWVVQESLVYPKLFQVLDMQANQNDMLVSIQTDWIQLIEDQNEWFNDLRKMDDVIALSPYRQSVNSIRKLLDLEDHE
jgi:tRNA A37 N6-isopentenylltransferase MiaA